MTPSFRTVSSLLILAFVLAVPTFAQLVNTETLRVGPEAAGFSGTFLANLSLQEGNTDTFGAGGALRLTWAQIGRQLPTESDERIEEGEAQPRILADAPECRHSDEEEWKLPDGCFNRRVWLLSASARFSEENEQRSSNEAFGHLRWTFQRTPRFGYEAFGQIQFNEFLRLDRRILVGAGIRLRLLASEGQELFWGSGYMVEDERLDVPEDGPDEVSTTHHRWTNYLSWKRNFDERRIQVGNILYFQPRFDEPDDFRLLNDLELSVGLTRSLSVGLQFRVAHDNDPPTGVEKTDYSLTNLLRYRF